jgi:transglutaminase-like putative cysteine protease
MEAILTSSGAHRPGDPTPGHATNTARIELDVALAYELAAPTSFVFTILPARTPRQQIVDELVTISPSGAGRVEDVDDGNRRLVRVTTDAARVSLAYRATVDVVPRTTHPARLDELEVDDIPSVILPFLTPSRYCESDLLGRFAETTFGEHEPGYARVQAISDRVGELLDYVPGVSDGTTTATDTLLARAGVCRDYAHLAIAVCRALGLPARYVSGYGLGVDPPDFHGFFEAYLGDDWYLFDPTGMAPTDGLVRIVSGRDAADASFADIYGDAELVDKQVTVARTITEPASEPDAPASTA